MTKRMNSKMFWKYGVVLACVLVWIAASVTLVIADEQSDISSETPISVPIDNEAQPPKITGEKKEVLMNISEQWLMENGSREYVSKEFAYLKGSKSMDTMWHEYEVTCYVNSTLLDKYYFTAGENITTKDIKISDIKGPLTVDLTVEPLEERELLRNDNELPEESEVIGDSTLGILTAILIAVVCIYIIKIRRR